MFSFYIEGQSIRFIRGVVLGNLLGPFLQLEAAVKAAPCGSVWLALHMDLPRALENRVNE